MKKQSKYTSWSKEELIKRIEALEKRKKYGLVWDEERTKEKFEDEAEGKLPVLKEVKSKEIKTDPDKPTHILIEGDNYHALSVLSYTHEKSIDVIYFDPPYNTGNKDFKYNDQWVNKDDAYRHSKWLSFLEKRIVLAKSLLKSNAAIFISIDNTELAQLKLLMDNIFGESNFIGCIVWKKKTGSGTKIYQIFDEHEYILIYAKDKSLTSTWRVLDENHGNFKNPDNDPRGPWESCAITAPSKNRNPNQLYCIEVHPQKNHKLIEKIKYNKNKIINIFDYLEYSIAFRNADISDTGTHSDNKNNFVRFIRRWAYIPDTMLQIFEDKRVYLNGKNIPRYKKFQSEYIGKALQSIYYNEYSTQDGSEELKTIIPDAPFDYPKPKDLLRHIIQATIPKDGIILDFFAGTGTTGHSVLELNEIDDGDRQFILCTNNENNICTEVCYPRISKVIKGYKNAKRENVDGLGGNLKYFKTSFVPSEPTDKNKELLTKEAVEMLCLRENTFNFVHETEKYIIFQNKERITGIIFDQLAISRFKKEASKYNKPVSVYVFSLSDDDFTAEFDDMKNKIKVCSIPEAILRIYRRIFK